MIAIAFQEMAENAQKIGELNVSPRPPEIASKRHREVITMYKKLVIVTRKTRLHELIERFNTRSRAKFYIEHAGGDFDDYQREDDAYRGALEVLQRELEFSSPQQLVDRQLVPTFEFHAEDLIVTLGQDGLVANTAKYVGAQPIVAVNPEPSRFDGILLPFQTNEAKPAVSRVMDGKAAVREITLAEAKLNDGQRLLAFNDFFIGASSHISALYRIKHKTRSETQSFSGVLVSTGAGSTGWVSSVFNMAAGVAKFCGGRSVQAVRLPWEDHRLLYVVRGPFLSRHSQVSMVAGMLERDEDLILESLMPNAGIIFSDGMESDFLNFNSGFIARVHAADQKAHLVVG